MHYRNGREALNGDLVIRLNCCSGKIEAFGTLQGATPGNEYCNGDIIDAFGNKVYACMCDCLHVDDVASILAEKNLDKRPAGK